MDQNKKWILFGFGLCLILILGISAKEFVGGNGSISASVATSADGQYVYVIGAATNQFYRSNDFGATFIRSDIHEKKE